eukprot:2194913-Amphidinium_carterae.1
MTLKALNLKSFAHGNARCLLQDARALLGRDIPGYVNRLARLGRAWPIRCFLPPHLKAGQRAKSLSTKGVMVVAACCTTASLRCSHFVDSRARLAARLQTERLFCLRHQQAWLSIVIALATSACPIAR